ncbi:MAG TPA: nucleoside-diphosphate sugar epimerase/dehydratase [Arenimonas sp.]|nr:nucleoside-diphosphate sugar epimerase/dehydratase [Arenimonas sp.]
MRKTLHLLPKLAIVMHDLMMVVLVWLGLRWMAAVAGAPPAPSLYHELALAVSIQGVVLWTVGLYRGLWRFASLPDLVNLVRAALFGVGLILLALYITDILPDVPRRVLVPYPIAIVLALGLPRLLYRQWKDYSQRESRDDAIRILILGAGRSAAALLRDLAHDGRYVPVGLLDDQPGLAGAKLHGVPVLGSIDQLPELARETAAGLIVISMPSASAEQMQRVVALCDEAGLPFRTVPRAGDVLADSPRVELSEVAIEDLLGRQPVNFDAAAVAAELGGKTVLVTGAGGSIGSELARQCARAGVGCLVLLERAELALDIVVEGLTREFPNVRLRPLLADCGDATACEIALAGGVDLVFHTAACKQVPMLEAQLREALRNNVQATRTLARACRQAGIDCFLLISTDKAIEPVNVLGASKRMAEQVCQLEFRGSSTRLAIVRFGNVLDSAGSVVPVFRRQIEAGGPVTVTHPEVTRFFMTIPEACQLILQTSTLESAPQAIYTLDMGRPVAIRELAEQLIRLSGKRPGTDIRIEYTGLRPGEKLHEILFHPQERYQRTQHPRILRAEPRPLDDGLMQSALERVQALLSRADGEAELAALLREMVPEYTPIPLQKEHP